MAPRIVNLHPDPMLEGCLVYYFPLGETCIGADAQRCRVRLSGLDVGDVVCTVANHRNEKLSVRPFLGGLVRVNGSVVPASQIVAEQGAIAESQTEPSSAVDIAGGSGVPGQGSQGSQGSQELMHGDRLAIGRAHIFRVVLPRGRSAADAGHEVQFDRAMRELQANADIDPRWRHGVDAAVLMVKRDYGTREANLLLDEAKAASEVVATANSILDIVPPEWRDGVSHYELAVLFEADGPPTVCVVARRKRGGGRLTGNSCGDGQRGITSDAHRGASAGIWEFTRFRDERLPFMREAAELRGVEQAKMSSQASAACSPDGGAGVGDDFFSEVAEVQEAKSHRQRRASKASKEAKSWPAVDDWEAHAWAETSTHEFRMVAQLSQQRREELRAAAAADAQSAEPGFANFWSWLMGFKRSAPADPRESGTSLGVATAPSTAPPLAEMAGSGWETIGGWLKGFGAPLMSTSATGTSHRSSAGIGQASSEKGRRATVTGVSRPTEIPDRQPDRHVERVDSSSRVEKYEEIQDSWTASCAAVFESAATSSSALATATPPKVVVRRATTPVKSRGLSPLREGRTAGARKGDADHTPMRRYDQLSGRSSGTVKLSPSRASVAGSSYGESDVSSALSTEELVNIRVSFLLDGRLGVRLRDAEGLVVSGFDVPEAAEVGWRVRDDIVAVNGRGVRSKEDFRNELREARQRFPITFTVRRSSTAQFV